MTIRESIVRKCLNKEGKDSIWNLVMFLLLAATVVLIVVTAGAMMGADNPARP